MQQRKRRLKVVDFRPGTDVKDLLRAALERAERGETLALAMVEVQRGGDIEYMSAGPERGFRHLLVAGASYLLDDLKADE